MGKRLPGPLCSWDYVWDRNRVITIRIASRQVSSASKWMIIDCFEDQRLPEARVTTGRATHLPNVYAPVLNRGDTGRLSRFFVDWVLPVGPGPGRAARLTSRGWSRVNWQRLGDDLDMGRSALGPRRHYRPVVVILGGAEPRSADRAPLSTAGDLSPSLSRSAPPLTLPLPLSLSLPLPLPLLSISPSTSSHAILCDETLMSNWQKWYLTWPEKKVISQ